MPIPRNPRARVSWFRRFGAFVGLARGDDYIAPTPRRDPAPRPDTPRRKPSPADADPVPRDGSGCPDMKPTDAELRRAFAMAYRVSWPPAYEDAMRDPVVSRLVEMVARYSPAIARQGRQERPTLATMLRDAAKGLHASPEVVKGKAGPMVSPVQPFSKPGVELYVTDYRRGPARPSAVVRVTHPQTPPAPVQRKTPRFIDGKSRAAGERDDDDD